MPYCQQLRRAFTALDVLMYYSQSQCQVRWKLNDQLMSFRILARKTQKKTIDIVGAFLTEITTEEVLQLAMMADASDEELTLIRTFDQEFLCTGSLKSTVEQFADRVDYLYARSGALQSGFTAYVIW